MWIQRPAAIAVQFDQRHPELAVAADRALVGVITDQELAGLGDRDFLRVALAMVVAESKRADDLNVHVERRRDLLLGRGIGTGDRFADFRVPADLVVPLLSTRQDPVQLHRDQLLARR